MQKRGFSLFFFGYSFCIFAQVACITFYLQYIYAVMSVLQVSSASGNPYTLFASTVAGVAYLIRLTNITNYGACSVFPPHEVVELNIASYCDYGAITAISATNGCLIIGGQDGSVGCFRLGMLDSSAPGMDYLMIRFYK